MPSKFVLRDENTVDNPYMARLYGKGITQGRTVVYNTGDNGGRTSMLVLLAQGARERSDPLGCSKIIKVLYAGFEIPEFQDGARNWQFHPGTITNPPVYQAIPSVNTSTNDWNIPAHGMVTGDFVALHQRGTDVVIPASVPAIKTHTQYLVWKVDNDHIKILNQVTGTPLITNAFDITTSGTHLDRLFVYKANNAYYFDPVQGRPTFFGGVTITFSGIAYLEILLPANLSNGTDEPTNLKVIMQGKKVYDIQVSGETIAFNTAVIRDDPNNSLVSVDGLVNDQKTPITRYHKSFVDWRDRCDSFIDWQTDFQPVAPISFPTVTNATYNSGTNRITKTTATNAWDAWAVSSQFVGVSRAACELVWNGTTCAMHFNTANGGESTPTNRQGVKFEANQLWYTDGNTHTVIAPVAVGDRVRMVYEAGLFVVYKNGVALPSVSINQTQKFASFYVDFVIFTASAFIDQIGVAASVLPISWACQFFSDVNWTTGSVATTFPNINLSGNGTAPFAGVSPWGWSAIFTATIVPSFSELYTFSAPNIDDTIEVRINGSLILSGAYPASPTGTMNLVAGTSYDIEVKVQQSTSTISNPYFMQLKWSSPSQGLQLVPAASVPPRPVKRFQGGFVATQPTPAADLFELELGMSPGVAYADVDGQIRIVTSPDRTPCFTFNNDPTAGPVNVAKMTVKRQNARLTTNFWRYVYRDDDDENLQKKYVFIDRKARRAANGGKLIDFGQIIQYGVMQQTQMERIGETFATLSADLDIGWTVEGFLDSLAVCKGAFVNVIDPESGYTALAPALAQVTDEKLNVGDVETRSYELRIVTPDFYSDTAHGGVMPPSNSVAVNQYMPPGAAQSMTLVETTEPLPDNRYVSSISGDINFISTLPQFVQPWRGRVFRKFLTTKLTDVISYTFSTNLFTVASPSLIPSGSTPLLVVAALDGNDVPGASFETPYYVVNVSGSTFKLSKTIGGVATTEFTANASTGLALYAFADWVDTLIDVFPDDNGHGTFELIPANKSLALIRVQTFSQAGSTIAFTAQLTRRLNVSGVVTIPAPPTGLAYVFDGVSIRWAWTPSTTFGINRYRITDGAGNFVSDVLSSSLWTETARGDTVTRRVYAVSDNGVLSATYAEATFVKPLSLKWSDPTNCQINLDNSITKTGTSGLNSAVWLSQAMLTDLSSINFSDLSGAPDKIIDQYFGVAESQTLSGGAPQFVFAFHLKADGTVDVINNLSVTTTSVGTYVVGDTFIFRNALLGTPSWVFAYKRDINGVETLLALVDTTGTGGNRPMPWYAALVVTTQGVISKIDLRWSTETIPIKGLVMDRAQNLVNASYNNVTGIATSTGGSGDGSSGLSFPDALPPHTDGGWIFNATGELAIGLNIIDSNQTAADIDYSLKIHSASNAQILHGTTVVFTFFATLQNAKVFIGREAGNVVVRLTGSNGVADSWSDATLAAASLIIDASFRHDIAPVTLNIRRHFLANAAIAPSSSIAFTEVGTKQVATIGGFNDASNFPAFLVVNPVLGQTLATDQNGVFINKNIVPITADPVWLAKGDLLVGTGPSAAAIQSVGANGRFIVADSAQTKGLKWTGSDFNYDGTSLTAGLAKTGDFGSGFAYWQHTSATQYAILSNTIGTYVNGVSSVNIRANNLDIIQVGAGGFVGINIASNPAVALYLTPPSAGIYGLLISGLASQSAPIIETRDSTTLTRFQILDSGLMTVRVGDGAATSRTSIAIHKRNSSQPENYIDFIEDSFGTNVASIASYYEPVGAGDFGLRFYTTGTVGGAGRGGLSTTPALALSSGNGVTFGGPVVSSFGFRVENTTAPVLDVLWKGASGSQVLQKYRWGVFPIGGPAASGDEERVDFEDAFGNIGARLAMYYAVPGLGFKIYTFANTGGPIPNATPTADFQQNGNVLFPKIAQVGSGGILDSPNASSVFYGQASGGSYSGTANVSIGVGAGAALTSGGSNTLIGYQAGSAITTGIVNVCIGIQAGSAITTGQQNVLIGYLSGAAITAGSGAVAIGIGALQALTTGSGNVAIGNAAGAVNSTGDFCVYIGYVAGQYALGTGNVAIGSQALFGGVGGCTGVNNTAIGRTSLLSNTTGQYNVGIGLQSGYSCTTGQQNTNIGTFAGLSNVTGDLNVFIGYSAGFNETGSNKLYISNSSTSTPLILGDFSALTLFFTATDVRQRYDASNYAKATIDANANVTFDLVAASGTPKYTFSKSVIARIEPRCQVAASSATPTANADTDDAVILTGMTAGATIGAPTGTPTQGQQIWYRFKDNGTSRSIAYNAIFRAIGVTLPTATVVSKTLYILTKYNSTDTKWDVIAVAQE